MGGQEGRREDFLLGLSDRQTILISFFLTGKTGFAGAGVGRVACIPGDQKSDFDEIP